MTLVQGLTWSEAEQVCSQTPGGHLTSIMDKEEMILLHFLLTTHWRSAETKIYIGEFFA